MPRTSKTDEKVMSEYGFEFSTPPENSGTRASKYDELFEAARELCLKFPGQSLKVVTYEKQSQPYNIAKAINNGEHRSFKDDAADWVAVARKIETEVEDSDEPKVEWAVWLTYEPKSESE
jgi:hypothetical protein